VRAHEHILEAVQRRLDAHPEKMRQRRETVEHPFATIKARMGAMHGHCQAVAKSGSELKDRPANVCWDWSKKNSGPRRTSQT
jgi:hypothetical protein